MTPSPYRKSPPLFWFFCTNPTIKRNLRWVHLLYFGAVPKTLLKLKCHRRRTGKEYGWLIYPLNQKAIYKKSGQNSFPSQILYANLALDIVGLPSVQYCQHLKFIFFDSQTLPHCHHLENLCFRTYSFSFYMFIHFTFSH